MAEAMGHVQRGAARVGRTLPADFHTAALVNVLMLEPGESLTSKRVIDEIGPAVMTNFHYLVDWVRETGKEPPAYVRPVWNEYTAYLRARAAADSHLTMHASHYATIEPDEAQFLTPEIIRKSAIDLAGNESNWFLPLKAGVETTEVEADPESLRINSSDEIALAESFLVWQQRISR